MKKSHNYSNLHEYLLISHNFKKGVIDMLFKIGLSRQEEDNVKILFAIGIEPISKPTFLL